MDKYEGIRNLPPLEVLSALGVDTSLFKKRNGKAEWYSGCPVHQSKNNRTCFSIAADGKFRCFSCDAKGRGAIDLVRAVRSCNFTDAVAFLQSITGQVTQTPASNEKAPLRGSGEATDGIVRPLEKDTWRKFQVPCEWLEKRIPDQAVRERYGVFCYNNPARKSAYSGRVMIPVKDVDGQLYGYLGRLVPADTQSNLKTESQQEPPKYLFPKNLPKSQFAFGADVLKAGTFGPVPLKRVFLVESPLCVMKFACLNIPAVAAYGWSVSDEQIELLSVLARGLIYMPDRNKYQEAQSVVPRLAARSWVRFPPLPEHCSDPEQMTLADIQALTK